MNFERNDGGYQPKGTPNGNCCEPPKGGSAMQDEFDDMPTEYSGIMRLKADAYGDVTNVFNALLYHGYEVTMRLEDATETEKELDGADKFVVIEYGEI